MLGAEGPKNVALAAEICDGWLPIFYSPRIAGMYNEWLDEGFARPGARRSREDFEICATAQVVVTDDRPEIMELMKPHLALYMGGMGAEDTNFHADVYRRMGYAEVVDDVTKLFRADRKDEAAKIIPDELVDDSAIVGDLAYVQEQVKAWEAAGVTMMVVGARIARADSRPRGAGLGEGPRVAERHVRVGDRHAGERLLGQAERREFLGVRVVAQLDGRAADAGVHTGGHLFGGGLTGRAIEVGVGEQRLRTRRHRHRQPASDRHLDDSRTVDTDVEPERVAVPNGEVRHDLRVAPDLPARLAA